MDKANSYSYSTLIFIIIIHLLQLNLLNQSEIKLVIKGKGTQHILYDSFPYEPSEIIVNGISKASCKKSCYLENEDKNDIIIKFALQINTCENMFKYLDNIIEADLSNFDTSKVTNMAFMFAWCSKLKKIDFGDIDTSLVTSIQSIFLFCEELTPVETPKFNSQKLESIQDIFASCYKLIAVKLKNLDTSKTKYMRGLFYRCYKLKYVDISNFQTPYVIDVSFMFDDCSSLIYADLSSFIIHNSIYTESQFRQVNNNLKICVKDATTRRFLPGSKDDCSNPCFNNNIKIDNNRNTCINSCNEVSNKYEYYNICFDSCPENTYTIINEFLCYDKKPKGYYFDKENNINKYKPCFETCKDCNKKGSEKGNNCIECKDGYEFLKDSMYISNGNCYEICNALFYFDEFSNFICVNECPEKFNKIIKEKNKCIDECKNDDIYKYEYNNTCYQACPSGSRFLFNYYCIDELINNQTFYLELIKNKVIKSINIDEFNADNDLIFINQEIAYTVSSTSKQNKNLLMKNVTSVNLGDCIYKLKDKYNISKDEEKNLYILKIDIPLEGMKIPKIEYEVYYPLYNQELIQLDLSICKNTQINISIPINISLDDLDLFNSSSALYNDICYTLTSESGTDKSLKDRKYEFINKNLTLCEENCKFIDYDNTTKKVICSCYTKINLPIISEAKIDTNLLLKNFKDIKNIGNFIMLKCLYLILQKDNIFRNSSNYVILLIFLISIFTVFFFAFHDYLQIKQIIKKIIKIKNSKNIDRSETKNIVKEQNKKIILNEKKNFNKSKRQNKVKKRHLKEEIKSVKLKSHKQKQEKINFYQNITNILKINGKNKGKKTKFKKQSKYELNRKKLYNKLSYIDDELNDLEYKDAIKVDKRTYCQYYISLLKTKHLFIFSFITSGDYNSKIIKIYLFFYTFLIEYTISAMFYTDSTMHEIYEEEGSFDIIYQLPQIIYSSLITNSINSIITSLGLCQSDILKIKNCNKNISVNKSKKVLKCIKCKIINFFIITYIFLILFWAYLGCFCTVYKNTQIHLLIEVSSSFATSLITPLFFNLLPGIFRIPSLKNIKSNRYILYKFSKILQIF